MSSSESDAAKLLERLHDSFLKNNEYDEGDLIFYRINYRIAEVLGATAAEAERLHSIYHIEKPRRVSGGYCQNCRRVVTIIPIIYGVNSDDLPKLRQAESEGRLIIGDLNELRQGRSAALFGCRDCKNSLPKYGTIL